MRFMVFIAVCARVAIPLFGTLTTHLYALQHGFAWVASAQMHNCPPDGACSRFLACKPRLAGSFCGQASNNALGALNGIGAGAFP